MTSHPSGGLIAAYTKTAISRAEQTSATHLPDGRIVYARHEWLRSSAIACLLRARVLPCFQTCFCGRPAVSTSVIRESSPTSAKWRFWRSRAWMNIGFCEAHRNESLEFSLYKTAGGWGVSCLIVAISASLVEHALRLGTSGDQFPPWVVFPGSEPYLTWNQGSQYHWRKDAWIPFWMSLESADQEAYMTRWAAPPDWRKALTAMDLPLNPYFRR